MGWESKPFSSLDSTSTYTISNIYVQNCLLKSRRKSLYIHVLRLCTLSQLPAMIVLRILQITRMASLIWFFYMYFFWLKGLFLHYWWKTNTSQEMEIATGNLLLFFFSEPGSGRSWYRCLSLEELSSMDRHPNKTCAAQVPVVGNIMPD
jgi:hypothetical protein